MVPSVKLFLPATGAIAIAAFLCPGRAVPAEPSGGGQDVEMVVTPAKRSTTVQETPISMTAVSGDDLQERGYFDFTDFAIAVPNLSVKNLGPGQVEYELRGMTSSGGNSPTVGFYLDDVPIVAPTNAQNGKMAISPALFDLSRIEILRGPQGTLYGSGSMGGTIKVIPAPPDPKVWEATAASTLSDTDGGGFNHRNSVMANLPLAGGKLALRVVGSESHDSGWIDRIVAYPFPVVSPDGVTRGNVAGAPIAAQYKGSNDGQRYDARIMLLWRPSDRLTIEPTIFYSSLHYDGISAYDSNPGRNAEYKPFNIPEPMTDRQPTYELKARLEFEDFDVTSIVSYWNRFFTQVQDNSEYFDNPQTGFLYSVNNGGPNPGYYGPMGSGTIIGHEDNKISQTSEELRFASNDSGRLDWVGGVYLSDYWARWNFQGTSSNPTAYTDLGTLLPPSTGLWLNPFLSTEIRQAALFGTANYAITEQFKATVGARLYSFNYAFTSVNAGWGSAFGAGKPAYTGLIKQDATGVNPKVDLEYKVDSDAMAYLTIAKGYRPGGGNALYPTTGPYWSAVFAPYHYSGDKWPNSYRPDSVWSFELGEKARLFNRALTLNSGVYYEYWGNPQLEAEPGAWAENINGKAARIYGAETELTAKLPEGFKWSLGAGLTEATVNPGPHWLIAPPHKLSDVAPYNGNMKLNYNKDISDEFTFYATAEYSYMGPRFSLAFPNGYVTNGAYIKLPGYGLARLHGGIQSVDGWSASLFVNNLLNKRAKLEELFEQLEFGADFQRIVANQPLTAGMALTYRY